MPNIDLTKQFAQRLHDALINAGYNSNRSTSGVNINKLAEITGYSTQICRKYLRGQAIPEPSKLVEIATALHVAPGWLLFGDAHCEHAHNQNEIIINQNLLHYIFERASLLYTLRLPLTELSDFLLDIVRDVSQINASEEQSKKIIDLALSSAKHLHNHSS